MLIGFWGAYIFVLKEAEHLDLAVDAFAGHQILEDVGHLFECHALSIARICYGPVHDKRRI